MIWRKIKPRKRDKETQRAGRRYKRGLGIEKKNRRNIISILKIFVHLEYKHYFPFTHISVTYSKHYIPTSCSLVFPGKNFSSMHRNWL